MNHVTRFPFRQKVFGFRLLNALRDFQVKIIPTLCTVVGLMSRLIRPPTDRDVIISDTCRPFKFFLHLEEKKQFKIR